MLIGVISDTHDHLTMIDRALGRFERLQVQALIHAGDLIAPFAAQKLLQYKGPIYVCYGNNDGEREGLQRVLPQIKPGPLKIQMAGRRILLHHFIAWCAKSDIEQADIVISGHTHEVSNQRQDGRLFLNPGECCGWVSERPTVAVLDTDQMHAEIIEL
jgi:putative phosphoesterase